MSSNSNYTYSQSSNGSLASDLGSSTSSTGRQLRRSTRGHDTAPASQPATQGDSQATRPNTQDTIHVSQGRTTTPSAQSGTSGQNTPDVDINVVLRALTADLEAQRRPGTAATPCTGSIAQLLGNDLMLLSIQEIFPALDTAVVQSIYTNKFQAANLLKLEASFTYKKNRPQFYSF
jgi:hypothetical protein